MSVTKRIKSTSVGAFALAALLVLVLGACSKSEGGLTGVWKMSKMGAEVYYKFNADNTYEMVSGAAGMYVSNKGNYSLEGTDKIKIDVFAVAGGIVDFEVAGDTLKISAGGRTVATLSRSGDKLPEAKSMGDMLGSFLK